MELTENQFSSAELAEAQPLNYPKTIYMQLADWVKSGEESVKAKLINLYNDCADRGQKLVPNSPAELNAALKGKSPAFVAAALGGGKYKRTDPYLHLDGGRVESVAKLTDKVDIEELANKVVDNPSLGEKAGLAVNYLKTFVVDQVKLLNNFKKYHLFKEYREATRDTQSDSRGTPSLQRVADWLTHDPKGQAAAESYEVKTDPHERDFMPLYVKIDKHLDNLAENVEKRVATLAQKAADLAKDVSQSIKTEFHRRR